MGAGAATGGAADENIGNAPDAARDDLTLGATAPTKTAHTEVRFGLVLYGGVSLAIYIYGVVFEFWRLMEASEKNKHGVWRALLDDAGVTAAVDIVSGTSAGGINGVLLAKAVACGSDLSKVQSIWVDDAEIADLLQPQDAKDPGSLLQTNRFEKLLAGGLKKLDSDEADSQPLARVFDLFVSATRLRPRERAFPTDLGSTIQTRQYRERFHFKLRSRGYIRGESELGEPRNDFAPSHNARLADAARATSAFPGAFEPKEVKGAIGDLSANAGVTGDPEEAAHLVDGGVLHNKPFTETVDAIVSRASDSRVERWLVSVEPDPEGRDGPPAGPPLIDEVISKSLFGIPRYQSIAVDLERLEAHRRYVKRQNELLTSLDERLGPLDDATPEGGLKAPGAESVQRAAQLSADLASEIAAVASLSEAAEQELEHGFRGAIENDVLSDGADFSFEKRRVYFLIKRLTASLKPETPTPDDLQELLRELWAEFDRISQGLWAALNGQGVSESIAGLPELLGREQFRIAALQLASALNDPLGGNLAVVRTNTAALCARIDQARPMPTSVVPATVAFAKYAQWDAYLLPVDPLMGFSRDTIRLARVSPKDAGFIGTAPADKLAGDSLAHFGGFLKRDWRINDILWGRLDAAEQIVRMVGVHLPEHQLENHIKAIQADIVRDVLGETPDYRKYLNGAPDDTNAYRVGSQSLGDVGARKLVTLTVDATGIARRLLSGLETGHPTGILHSVYRYIGVVVGWVLAAVRWPVETIWGTQRRSVKGVSIGVLAATAWSVVSIVLASLGQLTLHFGGYIITAAGVLAFVAWTVVMAKARRLARHPRPPKPVIPSMRAPDDQAN